MSGVEDRALLALRLLGAAAPSSGVSRRLFEEASRWWLDPDDRVELAGPVPVEVFESLSSVPARWAEAAVAAIDVSTPEGVRCAELAAADARVGVRRALAPLPGLPVGVFEAVVTAAVAGDGTECLSLLVHNQDATLMLWARWLSGPQGDAFTFPVQVLSHRLAQIGFGEEPLRHFFSEVGSPTRAAEALSVTLSGSPHLVDLLDAVEARGDETLRFLLEVLSRRPQSCDDRTVEWLSSVPGFSVRGGLSSLEDPVAVRRWWNSGISGRFTALFDPSWMSSLVVVRTVAELLTGECRSRLAAGEGPHSVAFEVMNLTSLMASFTVPNLPATPDRSEAYQLLGLLDVVLDLCEEFHVDEGCTMKLFRAVLGKVPESELTSRLSRFAAGSPVHAGVSSLLFRSPPVEVMDVVAGDLERFGVTASAVVSVSLGGGLVAHPSADACPAGFWSDHPDRFQALLVSLPWLVAEVTRDAPRRDTVGLGRVLAPVAEFVADRLGERAEVWDSFLSLAPSFLGSVAELVEVCSTFTD